MTARSAQGLGVGHLDTSHVQHCSALQATRLCHRMQQCSTGAAGTRGHHREQEVAVKFSFNICSSFWNCHEHQMNNTLLLKGQEKNCTYRYLQDMKRILWYEWLVECFRRRHHILCDLVSCYGCHCVSQCWWLVLVLLAADWLPLTAQYRAPHYTLWWPHTAPTWADNTQLTPCC